MDITENTFMSASDQRDKGEEEQNSKASLCHPGNICHISLWYEGIAPLLD